jgi:hypothetical protein
MSKNIVRGGIIVLLVSLLGATYHIEDKYFKPGIYYYFSPSEKEKKMLSYANIAKILPNYPNIGQILLFKTENTKPRESFYVAIYLQYKSKYYESGLAFCVITSQGDKLNMEYRSRSYFDYGISKIEFVDFDNDGLVDVFLTAVWDGYESVELYKNNKKDFFNNVIYFTDFYMDDECYQDITRRNIQLKDIDGDRKYELIVETDKFTRIYKWNGEVYVINSKTPFVKGK